MNLDQKTIVIFSVLAIVCIFLILAFTGFIALTFAVLTSCFMLVAVLTSINRMI